MKYDHRLFGKHLKDIRVKNNLTQEEAVQKVLMSMPPDPSIKISKFLWSDWERENKTPNIKQLVYIAEAFEEDITSFFLIDNQETKKVYKYFPVKDEIETTIFETSISRKIIELLKHTEMQHCVGFISTSPGTGVTTTLKHYGMNHMYKAFYINAIESEVIESIYEYDLTNIELIIIDDANFLNEAQIEKIIFYANTKLNKGIIFFGKNIISRFKNVGFISKIRYRLHLPYLTPQDILPILTYFFSTITVAHAIIIGSVARYQISAVFSIIHILKVLLEKKKTKNIDETLITEANKLYENV